MLKTIRVISAALLAVLLILVGASVAFAADGFGGGTGSTPTPGGGGSGGGNNSGGGSSGGGGRGGGNSGGGGTSQPPRDNPVWTNWTPVTITAWGSQGTCGVDKNGQTAVGLRTSWEYRVQKEELANGQESWSPNSQEIRNRTTTCLYPPQWEDMGSETCIVSTRVAIDITAPRSVHLGEKNASTAYAANRTVANCRASRQYLELFVQPDQVGRYEFNGNQNRERCTLRVYSAGYVNGALTTPAPELVNCGAIPALRVHIVGEQTCSGWTNGNSGRTDWSGSECSDQFDGSGVYQCLVGEPVINGLPGTQQDVLARGGEGSLIQYGRVGVVGNSITALGAASTWIERSGTPINPVNNRSQWLTDIDVNGKSILANNGTRSGWKGGLITDLNAIMYQASDYSAPNQISTQWKWDDTRIRVNSVRITGIDPVSLTLVTAATTVEVSATVSCKAPVISLNGLRGAIDIAP